MKQLLIIGAGGFGREVLGWALEIQPTQREWEIAGFLDSKPDALLEYSIPYRILGDPTSYRPNLNELFVCAIGKSAQKLQICRALKRQGAQFASLIHPSATVGPNCTLGEGCLLCPGAVLTTDVKLGDFVAINVHASVGHDVVIGDGCTLNAHSDVTGYAQLGEGVLLGSHASVLPNAIIGDYAIVGAGSVVLRKVNPHVTVMGVPAKQIAGF